jgi:hypothetical protein
MAGERNAVPVETKCREEGWNALPSLQELGYCSRDGVGDDAICTVLREEVGKRGAMGKKRKDTLPVEKSKCEEVSNDDNFVSGTLHRTSILASLSNEGEGDAGRKKDRTATKRSRSKAAGKDKLVPTDSKIKAKEDPRLIKALGRKNYLELLLEGKNGVQPDVMSPLFSYVFSCIFHVSCFLRNRNVVQRLGSRRDYW